MDTEVLTIGRHFWAETTCTHTCYGNDTGVYSPGNRATLKDALLTLQRSGFDGVSLDARYEILMFP